jgi:hypothetical protein
MKRGGIFITSILSIFLLLIGCATTGIEDYEPKSPDEEAIVSLMSKWKETWNSGNVQGNLDLWHDDVKIMYGGGRYGGGAISTTYEEAKNALPGEMETFGRIKLGTPKINSSGKEANVEILVIITEGQHIKYKWLFTFDLAKENNQWLIMGWKFS